MSGRVATPPPLLPQFLPCFLYRFRQRAFYHFACFSAVHFDFGFLFDRLNHLLYHRRRRKLTSSPLL